MRTGKVRLVFRPLAIVGPDSVTAARVASAAAAQNRMWQFLDRFYSDQRPENNGYVTEKFLRAVGGSTPSFLIGRTRGELRRLDVTSLSPEAFSGAIERELAR